MSQEEKFQMLNPLRYVAAVSIAGGGSMHAIGLVQSIIDNQTFPWWFRAIFLIAIPGYFISAAFILKNWRIGYYFAVAGPITGGLLIFFGFLFRESQLLSLIPGTYKTEITAIGFLTLIIEPVAVTVSAFLIYHKIWDLE